MRVCTKEYLANKAAIEARGFTEKDYVADCLLRPASAAATPPAAAPDKPAPVAATPKTTAPAQSSFPWVVVASTGTAPGATLGGYEGKDTCIAAAKAIRLNLKKAAEAAKVDCIPGGTQADGAPK